MAGASLGACCYYNSRCSLPSAWEYRVSGMRNQHAMQYLKVDGVRVRYVGPGEDDSQAATIRANYPLPADCPLYYFEVKILDKGQDGFIGVGFCTDEVLLSRLPGWDPHSYGYHGDDGHAFAGSGLGRPYGPPYTAGDVIGALYDKAERSISFFKNGEPLGVAVRDVQVASPLFPCVGLRTRGEEVVANFGTGTSGEAFRTDFAALRAGYQQRVMAAVRKVQLPLLSSHGTALMPQLMYDYLLHQRYWRTAAVLGRDLLRSGGQLDERELSDITVRQQSYDLVAAGQIDNALTLLRDKYPPELLSDRQSLDFRLRLQMFVEMVAAANAAAVANAAGSATCASLAGSSTACSRRGGSSQHGAAGALAQPPHGSESAAGGATDQAAGSSPMETLGDSETRGSGGDGQGPTAAGAALTTREILAYGTSELCPRCRTPTDRDLLTDALSLLAFTDPAASPAGYMLRPAHRVALAEELNGAMLACRGLPATSPLERLYQQLSVVVSELKRTDHPQAIALPDPRVLVMEPPQTAQGGGGGTSGRSGNGMDAMTA